MDWVKIYDKHLFRWPLKEIGAVVRLQLLTAKLERMPTPAEMVQEVPKTTLRAVQARLKPPARTLQEVLELVLEDAQAVVDRRLQGRARKEKWLKKHKKQTSERVTRTKRNEADKIREDKIREDESVSKGKAERVPPSLSQIKEFWEREKLRGDPEQFFNHFQSNGWRVGGRAPMKDWLAAARNWSKRETKDVAVQKPPTYTPPKMDGPVAPMPAELRDKLDLGRRL